MKWGSQQPASDPGNGARLLPSDEVVEVRREGVRRGYITNCNRVLRVLVVDDNTDTADTLALLVRMWGHDSRVAYDGVAALDMTFSYHPDVLLLDVALPQMNGFRLARVIRQQARFNGALLVAISGYAEEEQLRLGKQAGFDHYLVKPAELATVENLLRLQTERLAGPQKGHGATPPRYACLADRQVAPAVAAPGVFRGESGGDWNRALEPGCRPTVTQQPGAMGKTCVSGSPARFDTQGKE